MAQEEKNAEESAPPKSKKLLVIIVGVVVLVLVLGGAAAFLLLGGKDKKHGKDHEQGTEESADAEHAKPPPMITFEEKFTVNLRSDDGSSHFMQIPKMELEMADEESAKKVEERKSKVSDRINSMLRSKSMKDMLEPGSDLKLKEELRSVVNEAIEVKAGKKGVKEVILPASFIVQ